MSCIKKVACKNTGLCILMIKQLINLFWMTMGGINSCKCTPMMTLPPAFISWIGHWFNGSFWTLDWRITSCLKLLSPVGRNKSFGAPARTSVSGILQDKPETPPRATLGWSYSGLRQTNLTGFQHTAPFTHNPTMAAGTNHMPVAIDIINAPNGRPVFIIMLIIVREKSLLSGVRQCPFFQQ